MKLVKTVVTQYYACSLIALQIMNDEEFKILIDAQESNRRVYLGEVSGKHSEVILDVKKHVLIEVITEDESKISMFIDMFPNKYFGNWDILGAIQETMEEMENDEEENDEEEND